MYVCIQKSVYIYEIYGVNVDKIPSTRICVAINHSLYYKTILYYKL